MIGALKAHSAEQALRRYFAGDETTTGVFVAVSANSFKPRVRQVKTQTSVSFVDPGQTTISVDDPAPEEPPAE